MSQKRRGVTLSDEQWRDIKVAAAREGISISEVISRILRRALAPTDGKK